MHKLFISHKHEDRPIADEVASLVRKYAGSRVEIHLSSNSLYSGPIPGARLNDQILDWLSQADGFFLVYTKGDRDWSYCMFEYGVVSNRNTPPTNCFVLRCTSDKPPDLINNFFTDARDIENIRRFTRHFFCGTPFPKQSEPFQNWDDGLVEQASQEFFERLQPQIQLKSRIEWTNWPMLRICFPIGAFSTLTGQMLLDKAEQVYALLQTSARVLFASYDCAAFFGYRSIDETTLFGDLLRSWQIETKNDPHRWLDDLAMQIVRAIDRRVGVITRVPIVSSLSRQRLQMFVTEVTRDEITKNYEIEIIFIDFSAPTSTLVRDVMIPIQHVSYKILFGHDKKQIFLLPLLKDMREEWRNRVIFLWDDRTPAYILDMASINSFFVKSKEESNAEWAQLTMHDLLNDLEMDTFVKRASTVVSPEMTFADARDSMHNHDRTCRSAFVTPNGKLGEVALGLINDDSV